MAAARIRAALAAPTAAGPRSSVKRLPAPEHADELLEPARARLGPLGVVEAVEDRVAVRAVEGREVGRRDGVGVELGLEIRRHLDAAGRRVGGIPAAVGLGALDLGL